QRSHDRKARRRNSLAASAPAGEDKAQRQDGGDTEKDRSSKGRRIGGEKREVKRCGGKQQVLRQGDHVFEGSLLEGGAIVPLGRSSIDACSGSRQSGLTCRPWRVHSRLRRRRAIGSFSQGAMSSRPVPVQSAAFSLALRSMPIDAVNAAVKAQILAEALPYIQRFHDKTIIVKYGGNAMTEASLKAGFARDVVMLKLVGMNPVIVHGGGPQIGDLLKKMGIESEFRQGMRVTDEKVMNVVEMVLGELNQEIVGLINQQGGKAVGLTGQDGAFIHARKMLLKSEQDAAEAVDIGLVGEIERIDPELIHLLDSRDFIPVVAPI